MINYFDAKIKNLKFFNRTSADTVFLASFPKSGNTWLRFMLANLYNDIEPRFKEIDFHNIHDIIPEDKMYETPFNNFPKVIKTHSEYKQKFRRVILIIRNPYDTLYSYFEFLNKEKKINLSFPEVIHHNKFGVRAIVRFVNSYINNCSNLFIITYEQLHFDSYKFFKKLVQHFDIKCKDENIKNAIKRSSFGSMEKVELSKGRKYGSKDFIFMRSGQVGDGYEKINSSDLKYIKKYLKESPLITLLYD